MMIFRVFTAACAVAMLATPSALADSGHAHFSAGEPGDASKPARTIEIVMSGEYVPPMTYAPERIQVKRNEQIRFVLKNDGLEPHEFVLASKKDNLKHEELMKKFPDMEHDDPNAKTVAPGKTAEILWRFTKPGTFEFVCLIPGHRAAGMVGSVTVK